MSVPDEFDSPYIERAFEQFFDAALDERGLERGDFRKGQVLFKSPFAKSQYDGMSGEDNDIEIRINDEANIVLNIKVAEGESIEAGEMVTSDQLGGVESVRLAEEDQDFGHITVAYLNGVGWLHAFDLRKNQSYFDPLREAANQFIETTEYAFENELWRAFVENAFHAAERMMKIEVISIGWLAESHSDVQAKYRVVVDLGIGDEDLYDVYNKLHGMRFSASYVDPRDGADEKNFELDSEDAEDYLNTITEHREQMID